VGSGEVAASRVGEPATAIEMGAPDVGRDASERREETGVGGEHDNRGMSTPNLGMQVAEDVMEKQDSSSNIAKQT